LDILKRLQSLVDRSGLDIEYNSHVTSIECQSDLVVVRSTDKFWLAKEVVFGHGILPPRTLTIDGQLFSFNMVKERRPSLHFKVIPNRQNLCKYHNSTISQVVFPRGSLIKYCHNLNKFIQDARCSALYLVVALRHSSQNSLETVSSVVSMLINYGIMPPERQIASLEYFWQDVYLPLVTTHELERIELASNMRVRTLLTEELCGGLGKYSEHWHALKSWIRQNPFP
jgi:hypothetical protein